MARTGLIILGMHRSGTSALAGTFARLGFVPPAHPLDASDDNPSGFYEPEPVVEANRQIMAQLEAHWNNCFGFDVDGLPGRTPPETVAHLAQILADEFPGDGPFVLKDPRICVLYPIWAQVFGLMGVEPRVLFMLRHPAEVIDSLISRNGFPVTPSAALTLHHMLEAERATRDLPRSLVSYDDLLGNWQGIVSRSVRETGLVLPRSTLEAASEIEAFLDGAARHHKAEARSSAVGREPIGKLLERAWKSLLFLARSPGDGMSLQNLDHVHEQFLELRSGNKLGEIFAPELV